MGWTFKCIFSKTFDLLEQLCERRPELTVVWRTSGFGMDGMKTELLHNTNDATMDRMDQCVVRSQLQGKRSNLLHVSFGGAVEPRSCGNEHIVGDMKAHCGFEARFASLQMLTNVLVLNARDLTNAASSGG